MMNDNIKEREATVEYYNIVLRGVVVETVKTYNDARLAVINHPGSCYTPIKYKTNEDE